MGNRFNFTKIELKSKADITEVMNNFNNIEDTGAIIDDLPKVTSITLTASDWVKVDNYYQYTISNSLIQDEPYHINVLFDDLSLINSPIYPKVNSQSSGKIILRTNTVPTVDLTAKLIVTKGVQK
jgi:hypothetical protein